MPFILPTFTVLLAFAAKVAVQASATPISAQTDDIFSESQLLTWLSTTDAKLTYVGAPVRGIQARAGVGGNVTVVYCTKRTESICGGSCTVYTGGEQCLKAPGTDCLRATANVAFCSNERCNVPCNQFDVCGFRLNDGFCFTPNTVSINVPFVTPDDTTTSAPRSSQTSVASATTSAPRSTQTSVESATTSAPRSNQTSDTSGTTQQTSPGPASSSTAAESGQPSATQHSGISQRTGMIAGPVVGFCAALLLIGIAILVFVKRRRRTRERTRTNSDVSPIPLPAWRPDQQEPPPYIPMDTTDTQPGFVSELPSTGKRRL